MKCNKCNVNEVPAWRKTKCNPCALVDDAAYKASQQGQQRTAQPETFSLAVERTTEPEIKKPTGEYQSLVYNKTLSANSFEVGKAGGRFKFYFETIGELKAKIKEAVDAKLMVEFVLDDPFKAE